jgi:hypothetical protein
MMSGHKSKRSWKIQSTDDSDSICLMVAYISLWLQLLSDSKNPVVVQKLVVLQGIIFSSSSLCSSSELSH